MLRSKRFVDAILIVVGLLAVSSLLTQCAVRPTTLPIQGAPISEITETETIVSTVSPESPLPSTTPTMATLSPTPDAPILPPGGPGAVTNETSATFPSSQNGAVSIVTDKGEYTVGETIVVTVTNNLNIPITTVNQQAFCTIIRMESQKGGNWQEIKNCYSGEPVAEVTIKPGEKVVKHLETHASGTYRVGLIYSEGDAYDIGKLLAIFTLAFDVKG